MKSYHQSQFLYEIEKSEKSPIGVLLYGYFDLCLHFLHLYDNQMFPFADYG